MVDILYGPIFWSQILQCQAEIILSQISNSITDRFFKFFFQSKTAEKLAGQLRTQLSQK